MNTYGINICKYNIQSSFGSLKNAKEVVGKSGQLVTEGRFSTQV